jgi:2-furoyl-CoA dehydrogenase large subunit
MMHSIAVELGLDPLEVIRRNLISAGSFPYRAPAGALIDSGDYQRVVAETVRLGGLEELQRMRARVRAEGRLYGIGYAVAVEPSQSNMGYISTLKTGIERERAGQKDGAVAAATVNMDPLGGISVVADSVPQGQGHQTALAQIVADELGVGVDDVVVNLETDTQKDGWSIAAGNYSCRFAPATTSATHIAARRLREKLARIAAASLNVPADAVEFGGGKVFARGNPENALSLHRVAGQAHWSPAGLPDGMEPALRESVTWSAPELTPTTANDEINTSLAYGFGFDFCGATPEKSASTNTSPATIAEPFSTRAWPTARYAAPSPRRSALRSMKNLPMRRMAVFSPALSPTISCRPPPRCRSSIFCIPCSRRRRSPGSAQRELPKATSTARRFASPTQSPTHLAIRTSRCRSSRQEYSSG